MTLDFTALSNIEILGLTIIGEARGEPIEGQVAVGSVIRNRMHYNPGKYHTYYDVCLEKKQFSCWNENDPNRSFLIELVEQLTMGQLLTDPYLRQCMYVSAGIVKWDILDNTGGAINYLTKQLYYSLQKPHWATKAKNVNEIGTQVFFNV